jgi:xanthine dehydrogenase/oxidase
MICRQAVEVGKSRDHLSALKQVTGEAVYLDDMPRLHRELYAGIVFSRHAHAKILSIDPNEALQMPGVHAFVSRQDVQGSNIIGPVFKDEEVFADGKVYFVGQIIALVLADNQRQAQEAARIVKVEYESLPAIITIEEAVQQQSFFSTVKKMERGDIEAGFADAEQIIEGEIRMGGQEHFYLETQASIVIPKREDDEIEIWASTQNPTETQVNTALFN